MAKSGDFRAKLGEKMAIFHHGFEPEWHQEWRFWALIWRSEKIFSGSPASGVRVNREEVRQKFTEKRVSNE